MDADGHVDAVNWSRKEIEEQGARVTEMTTDVLLASVGRGGYAWGEQLHAANAKYQRMLAERAEFNRLTKERRAKS